jgi:hypothetical protein
MVGPNGADQPFIWDLRNFVRTGAPLLSFGNGLVRKWIPPEQMLWAIATTVFFLFAAAAILSGFLAGLASRLLTTMIVGFEALVWAPRLVGDGR